MESKEKSKPAKTGVANEAFISKTATLGENLYIGAFAFIGENVKIGKNPFLNLQQQAKLIPR